MSDFYKTLVHWQDPTGQFHEVGEIAEIDPSVVFDLADLVRIYTVVKVDAPVTDSPQGELPSETSTGPVIEVSPTPVVETPTPEPVATPEPVNAEAVG